MKPLNLPSHPFRHMEKNGKIMIFDSFRKSWVKLTPEEWVRQNFLMWLVNHLGFPPGLIAVETSLTYNTLKKRADAVVYGKDGNPLMIIECKAPDVEITQKTFEQAAGYNYTFRTSYLALTNGMNHYCCQIDFSSSKLVYLENFPQYTEMK
jgi:hypothetical protein